MSLATESDQRIDMVAGGHKVDNVVDLKTVKTARNDGFMIALDGSDVETVFGHAKLLQLHTLQRRVLPQFHTDKNQFAIVKFEPMTHPIMTQRLNNLKRGKIFGINQRVYTDSRKELTVVHVEKLVIVDARYGALRSDALGH